MEGSRDDIVSYTELERIRRAWSALNSALRSRLSAPQLEADSITASSLRSAQSSCVVP